jgi:hypothetical protein
MSSRSAQTPFGVRAPMAGGEAGPVRFWAKQTVPRPAGPSLGGECGASPRLGASPSSGDEYLVDLARAAAAAVLVSGDAHLLDLRDRLPVMTPAEFLATLGG